MPKSKSKVSFHAKSIYDIDPSFFRQLGVKAVVLDLDNTLDPADVEEPSERARKILREYQDMGLKVFILSNNTEKRCGRYCQSLGVPYLSLSFKYVDLRIRRFLKRQNVKVEDCIFIGDQIYTDRLYVKQLHGRLVLTEPLSEKDNLVTKIPRFFDKHVRECWRRKGLLGSECPKRNTEEVESCSSSEPKPVA